jgi:hypothetical protein
VTRCAGIHRVAARRRAWPRPTACRSPGTARPTCTRNPAATVANCGNLEYFHDHVRIEQLLFGRRARTPDGGTVAPGSGRPGIGLVLDHSAADPVPAGADPLARSALAEQLDAQGSAASRQSSRETCIWEMPSTFGDLCLGHVAEETQLQDPLLAYGQPRDAAVSAPRAAAPPARAQSGRLSTPFGQGMAVRAWCLEGLRRPAAEAAIAATTRSAAAGRPVGELAHRRRTGRVPGSSSLRHRLAVTGKVAQAALHPHGPGVVPEVPAGSRPGSWDRRRWRTSTPRPGSKRSTAFTQPEGADLEQVLRGLTAVGVPVGEVAHHRQVELDQAAAASGTRRGSSGGSARPGRRTAPGHASAPVRLPTEDERARLGNRTHAAWPGRSGNPCMRTSLLGRDPRRPP